MQKKVIKLLITNSLIVLFELKLLRIISQLPGRLEAYGEFSAQTKIQEGTFVNNKFGLNK